MKEVLKGVAKLCSLILILIILTTISDYLLQYNPQEAKAAGGNVLINELEHNPAGTDSGNEWVELYNPTASSVDLSGWKLSTTHGKTVTLTLSGSIPPGGYLVVIYHSQWLDNEDEVVVLRDSGGSKVDETPQLDDTSNDGRSWCRYPNGGTSWSFRQNTKGAPNGGEPIPEPTIITMIVLILIYLGSSRRHHRHNQRIRLSD